MRQPPALAGRAAAAAAVLGLAAAWGSAGLGLGAAQARGLAGAAAALLSTALAGRIVLSWLSPGRVGGHGPAELPLTWAASHLLGSLVLGAAALLAGATVPAAAVLAVLLLLALAARLASLPAAMVPRHGIAHERGGPLTRLAERLALAALVLGAVALASGSLAPDPGASPVPSPGTAPAWRADPSALPRALFAWSPLAARALVAADLVAAALFLREALRAARLAPGHRLAFWAAAVFAPGQVTLARPASLGALSLAAALAGAVAWTRRASRRWLALALAGLAGLALAGRPLLALLGAAALVAQTAAPARAGVARGALLPLAAAVPALLEGRGPTTPWSTAGEELARLVDPTGPHGPLVLFALLALALGLAPFLPSRRAERGAPDPPSQAMAFAAVLLLGLLVVATRWPRGELDGLALAPLAALLAAAVFAPGERA